MLIAAGFFGYMLALLQRRVGSIVSSQDGSSKYGSSVSSREVSSTYSDDPILLVDEYREHVWLSLI